MINFHTEQPASEDVFPGGSHEKVADAMHRYIPSPGASKVIGLDGEFGSGKSTILNMLGLKLMVSEPSSRVWFFDCEQNYQGSIKSNFIELFTDELLKDASNKADAEVLRSARDIALGRMFTYRKKTTSRVSAWALALLTSLFFSATSFRELSAIFRGKDAAAIGLYVIHFVSFISPALVLWSAKRAHRKVNEGGEKWSLLSLFKGSSDDYINEKIEVAKEVTPLDLKRTLNEQLSLVSTFHYVVILDNLDRLPKDSLRAVWSDLEIFTSVAAAANLTVVVPFCSTKVATYLKADGDRQYDAKDFIAKKFPVVFRAPPVIASGWKGGFRQLWTHSFQGAHADVVEHCVLLLQRHTPMLNGLVTPRLQKKFINDIATTSLVVGDGPSLLIIAAHLLLCKYNDHPLDEILRVNGFSAEYEKVVGKPASLSVAETKVLLGSVLGEKMDNGWEIQFLQIHFLTSSEIAIAELLDDPLAKAIEEGNSERLFELASLFGFGDAFKRLVAKRIPLAAFLPTIYLAHEKHGGDWIQDMIKALNVARPPILSSTHTATPQFYEALKHCIDFGFDTSCLEDYGASLRKAVSEGVESPFDSEAIDEVRASLSEYDLYLYALGLDPEEYDGVNAAVVMHLLPSMKGLKVISAQDFSMSEGGLEIANRQLASCATHTFDLTPLPNSVLIAALDWAHGRKKLSSGIAKGISATDVASLLKICSNDSKQENALLGLALAEKVNPSSLPALQGLMGTDDTMVVSAVAAILCIRQGDASSFAQITDLSDVIDSPVFKALGRAALTSKMIIAIFDSEEGGAEIAPYFKELIQQDQIYSLEHGWIMRNFRAVLDSVTHDSFGPGDVLKWLNGWGIRLEPAGKKIAEVDQTLVDMVFEPQATLLSAFRKSAIDYLIAGERSEAEWYALIQSAAPQQVKVLEYLFAHQVAITNEANVTSAIVQLLTDVAAGKADVVLKSAQLKIVDALLNVLSVQQKTTIGIRLRPMLFDENLEPRNLAVILGRYGSLIPDLQPSSPGDIGRIVLFLHYVYDNPAVSEGLISFLDSRAEQIASFKYPKALKEAMAGAVKQLSTRAPELNKRFAETRGFMGFFRKGKENPSSKKTDPDDKATEA
ncbi:P-loop NTPase fold protein [Pseudomonas alliivorans]|nr:P-loop NTPase fold protein [Pseudomonas alliivorans]MEE5124831.1 P-loop NTPase fold protein [Pseudomonas alliivorans]MEE5163042.1 P-loop NTPase fold protein [Pseudomonas alliivorans]